MLRIELGTPAQRFLKKCDHALYERLITRIKSLSNNPFPTDIKRVVGRNEKIFRVRVGDYRIQYTVFYKENIILITDVDKRSQAYN